MFRLDITLFSSVRFSLTLWRIISRVIDWLIDWYKWLYYFFH